MKTYKDWIKESQKQATIAESKGIAPNQYEPYKKAQSECHKIFMEERKFKKERK
jgi:hypothetical protein